jgi:hypothetical protein
MFFPGIFGIISGVGVFVVIFALLWRRTKRGMKFNFEPTEGFFEKLLATFLDIAKYIVGLSSGGIVLIIGSSALASTSKRLPPSYADPLFLLSMSVFFGVLFMPLLALDYEAFRHKTQEYTRLKYVRNQTLGFSSLLCFCMGYGWLIWAAVRS